MVKKNNTTYKKKKQTKSNKIKYKKSNRKTKKTNSNNSNKSIKNKKNQKKIKTIKKPKCAPNPDKNTTLDFTCYTTDALEKMRHLWNARHPDCKIETKKPREIWMKLRDYMSDSCNSEICWIKQNFMKNNLDKEILNYTFAPKSPEIWKYNPNEWLSSLDIVNVMKQYEKKYKCFEFLGPSPINYDTHILYGDCVWEELCNFNLEKYLTDEKYKIGVIFNLDPHYKEGSHWVSLFINLRKKKIFFFDSYGERPDNQILKFIHTVIKQANHLGMNIEYDFNKKRHQYSNSECGMYSLYFIIENLKDTSIEKLFNNRISDKKMLELRKIYFN